jgi:hypothetical protein
LGAGPQSSLSELVEVEICFSMTTNIDDIYIYSNEKERLPWTTKGIF